MKLHFIHRPWTYFFVIGVFALSLLGSATLVAAQSSCGSTYTVPSGMSMAKIAQICGVTERALIAANPQISNRTTVHAGQVVNIPNASGPIIPNTGGSPRLVLSHNAGLPGSAIRVTGSGFPAQTQVKVDLMQGGNIVSETSATTNRQGAFSTQVSIPSSAASGSQWTVRVTALGNQGESASAHFRVVNSSGSGGNITTSVYIVQPGDTLAKIAAKLNTTVTALRNANPQFSFPMTLAPGMAIYVPGSSYGVIIPITGSVIQLSPAAGPAGIAVAVYGYGFPAGNGVTVSMHPSNGGDIFKETVPTNGNGAFAASVPIPANAGVGSTYRIVAKAQTSAGQSAQADYQVTSSTVYTPPTYTSPPPVIPITGLQGGAYIVQPGNTLTEIANAYGTTVNALMLANPQIPSTGLITPGEAIYLPGQVANINGQTVYIVASGDILSEIAARFNIAYSTLLSLNPQIADPNLIYPGEYVYLSSGVIPITGSTTSLQVNPSVGPASARVTITGSGFPANTPVTLTISQNGSNYGNPASTVSDASGNFSTQVSLPSAVQSGAPVIVTASAQTSTGTSATAQFIVAAPAANNVYTVQSGDTLASIAQSKGMSVNALLVANPQLNSSSQLNAGDTIAIPTRISFPAGGTSAVVSGSLPANTAQTYVLNAQAGQTMSINLTPANGNFSLAVYGENGVELRPAGNGAYWSGSLPTTQDYIIYVVSGNAASSYSMTVSIPPLSGSTPPVTYPPTTYYPPATYYPTPVIPVTGGQIYTVQSGDNLTNIANTFGITLSELLAANPQITDPNLIYPGQQILIP